MAECNMREVCMVDRDMCWDHEKNAKLVLSLSRSDKPRALSIILFKLTRPVTSDYVWVGIDKSLKTKDSYLQFRNHVRKNVKASMTSKQ